MNYPAGFFLILHGAVHLFYVGQSLRLFDLGESMTWPDGSWLCSRFSKTGVCRKVAAGLCVVATAGFLITGAGLMFDAGWWESVTVVFAIVSSLVFIMFWNTGSPRRAEQGGLALIINVLILLYILVIR
ncbi:MAG: hypothetical protein AB7V46_07930 [Thermomicrobiales bacterium]